MRIFRYIKNNKIIDTFEAKDLDDATNSILRWNLIKVEEVFDDE